jgi:hypothetical protein
MKDSALAGRRMFLGRAGGVSTRQRCGHGDVRLFGRVGEELDLRSGVHGTNEPRRVRARGLRSIDRLARPDSEGVLFGGARSDRGQAEAYHQDYATKHPYEPYIAINDLPKVDALKSRLPELYRR